MAMSRMQGVARARAVARSAYAPYSGFSVGCVVETSTGEHHVGSNLENASYGVTMCAEVGALMAASVAGGLADIRRVFVSGGRIGPAGELTGDTVVTPCGRCRQLIAEAATIGGTDIEVVCASGDGSEVIVRSISELLPDGFSDTTLAGEVAAARAA